MTSINQRAQLQNQICKIANDVRGSVDGWDFKQLAELYQAAKSTVSEHI
jgi:type I restriction-modification system DNA methylase subunit